MLKTAIARLATRGALVAATSVTLFTAAYAGPADPRADLAARQAPAHIQALKLDEPISSDLDYRALRRIDPALLRTTSDTEEVLIRLRESPVTQYVAQETSPSARRSQGQARKQYLRAEQSGFIARSQNHARRFEVSAQTQVVLNSVVARVSTADLIAIAQDPSVDQISRVRDYERHLVETVPQIGAAIAQERGFDGTGVKVAVLDSGIDYMHAAFGGPGTLDAYAEAYGADRFDSANTVPGEFFPTPKVVGGFDFVGELWVGGAGSPPRTEDPDPIGAPGVGSHGTNVADIIAGVNGVAPGADLYAVKTCAAYSSACNGVALLLGMEFSADPNRDGDISDRVDIINMSLGANFGQDFDNSLAQAVENLSAIGVLTVASAGNGGDNPFITGTPAAASTAISVAQTQVASVVDRMTVVEPAAAAGDYPAVFQSWSAPLDGVIEGLVTYLGPSNLGCEPLDAGSLEGQIVLVDRGDCGFSVKISNLAAAGAKLGIIGLVTADDPFNGGFGGGEPFIPGFMISQGTANILRSGEAVVRFDSVSPFAARIVDSSSRGPRFRDSGLKPEIGAPGASVSANSGTGDGTRTFGGTSGAAPMVAGSAAILMQAFPGRSLAELKAVLMNTAETDVVGDLAGTPVPVSRVGAGEVRVDAALASTTAAWDIQSLSGGLGFGAVEVADEQIRIRRFVRVRNYSNKNVFYAVENTFRSAEAEASGAVDIRVLPRRLTIPAGKDRIIRVDMTINGANLEGNFLNSGGSYSGANLTRNEYDGYLVFKPLKQNRKATAITMPWHVLPRQAARVEPSKTTIADGGDVITLTNTGVGTAQNDAYSLLLSLPQQPTGGPGESFPNPSIRGFGVQTFLVRDGFCGPGDGAVDYIMGLAFNLWERTAYSLYPGLVGVLLDTDGDGVPEYDVFNIARNFLGFPGDWRTVTFAVDVSTGLGNVFFFTEHAHNSANQVLLVCNTQIGNQALFAPMNALAYVDDVSFGGSFNAAPTVFAPLGERFFTPDLTDLSPGQSGQMTVLDFGAAGNNPGELGLLLITNGDRGAGAHGGATAETEAILFQEAPPPAAAAPAPRPRGRR
ncbi:S8 family serine peptidase [Wenzhouxiangella sp. XN24]|uniref:S8 family peptidase n=1 Tax=Wenzhouxiangella sp. XN24 TaxID=2713569 RepID=UPI0013EBF2FD|nr:S8 family serine peptidase [Wenzhouxiangella sp. XN24]NGX17430.1 S8 family serine peptidase [Wenzhouxiangella sp. XN24]